MENKIAHWKQIAEEWKQSGKTQKEFCKEHKIKLSTLHYWMGRVKKAEKEDSQLKELVCISMPTALTASSDIVLEIDNRYRLIVPTGFCRETLKKILTVIG